MDFGRGEHTPATSTNEQNWRESSQTKTKVWDGESANAKRAKRASRASWPLWPTFKCVKASGAPPMRPRAIARLIEVASREVRQRNDQQVGVLKRHTSKGAEGLRSDGAPCIGCLAHVCALQRPDPASPTPDRFGDADINVIAKPGSRNHTHQRVGAAGSAPILGRMGRLRASARASR